MIDADRLVTFLGTATLITLAPGPDNLQVVARGIAHGRRAALAAAAGFAAGNLGHTFLAVLGLAAALAASPIVFRGIQWVGAVYLAYVGIRMLRSRNADIGDRQLEFRRPLAVFRQSILANLLNPKVAVFFLALLPQFVDSSRPDATLQFAVLGLLFTLVVVLCFGIMALIAGTLGERLKGESVWQRRLQVAAGCVLISLGIHLAATAVAPRQ